MGYIYYNFKFNFLKYYKVLKGIDFFNKCNWFYVIVVVEIGNCKIICFVLNLNMIIIICMIIIKK